MSVDQDLTTTDRLLLDQTGKPRMIKKPPCCTAASARGDICLVHGTNFFAVPFMTVARDVPFASVADVKIKTISRMLFTHTKSTVAVRIKFPDKSNSLKLAEPVQSRFTV